MANKRTQYIQSKIKIVKSKSMASISNIILVFLDINLFAKETKYSMSGPKPISKWMKKLSESSKPQDTDIAKKRK